MKLPPTLPMVAMVALVISFSSSSCRRQRPEPVPSAPVETPAVPSKAPNASSQPGGSKPASGQPAEAIQDQLPTAPNDASLRFQVHKELTGAIHLYSMDHRRMPPDFETLVKEKYLKSMPKPPPGKRFALDRNRMQVVIMD